MKRLPKALQEFDRMTDSQLFTRAQAVAGGLTDEILYFTAPPFTPAELLVLYSDYLIAIAAARHGTKAQTAAKLAAKQALIEALRADATYVTQRVYTEAGNQADVPDYENVRRRILSSGFEVSKKIETGNTLGNVPTPALIDNISVSADHRFNVNGQLKLRVRRPRVFQNSASSIRLYQVQIRLKVTPPTPVNDWVDYTSSTSRILIQDLTPGTYEYRIAGIGGVKLGKNQINFSSIQEAIVT